MNIDQPMTKCFIKHPLILESRFESSILYRLSKRKNENKLWRTETSGLRESMSAGGEPLTILFKIFGDFTIKSYIKLQHISFWAIFQGVRTHFRAKSGLSIKTDHWSKPAGQFGKKITREGIWWQCDFVTFVTLINNIVTSCFI